MASAGMASTYVMMPIFGRIFDVAKIDAAGGTAAYKALVAGTPAFEKTVVTAATAIFQCSSIMPMATLAFFALLWFYDSRQRRVRSVKQNAAVLETALPE
jgi:hypothetical protein